MRTYKILISAYACDPGRGSEYGFGWNWAFYLAQLKHEVHVLTRSTSKSAIESVRKDCNFPNLTFEYVDLPDWFTVKSNSQLGIALGYMFWQWRAYRHATKLEARHSFDIVHHVTYGSVTTGSWLWRLGKPFVFGPVGGGQVAPAKFKAYFGREWSSEKRRSFLFKTLAPINPIMRSTLHHSKLVLATNTETADLAKASGAQQVELFLDTGLPESYFPEKCPVRRPSKTLEVLWVGRLQARKALPIALDAMQKIAVDVPVKLKIVGGGGALVTMKQLADDLKLGRNITVEFLGQIHWEEVKNAYTNSDIFLFTSLRDSFGSQMLEAMAYGLPVVTLNHQGSRDMLPDSASLKVPVTEPVETVQGLASAIQRLAQDRDLRQSMGEAAYEFACGHVWREKAKKMSDKYAHITQSRSQQSWTRTMLDR